MSRKPWHLALAILTLLHGLAARALCAPSSASPAFASQSFVLLASADELTALMDKGMTAFHAGQYDKSLNIYQEALTRAQVLKDKQRQVEILIRIGNIYDRQGDTKTARAYYDKALPLVNDIGEEPRLEAELPPDQPPVDRALAELVARAVQAAQAGRFEESLQLRQQALPQFQALRDKWNEARTLLAIGRLQDDLGRREAGLGSYRQALPLLERVADLYKLEATLMLTNIGLTYRRRGQFSPALECYHSAVSLLQSIRAQTVVGAAQSGEATLLNDIGSIYLDTGEPTKALDLYLKSQSLLQKRGDKEREAWTLNNIAETYNRLGEREKALGFYQQTLQMLQELGPKRNAENEALILSNLGSLYEKLKRPAEALQSFKQARQVFAARGDRRREAIVLTNMGVVYDNHKLGQNSLPLHYQALSLMQAFGDKPAEAYIRSNIAVAEDLQQQHEAAGAQLHTALTLLEDTRRSLGGLSELKLSFLESNLATYHYYINLLQTQGDATKALEWVEKTKARALLDLMVNGRVDLTKGVSAEDRQRLGELMRSVEQLNQQLIAGSTVTGPNRSDASQSEAGPIKQQLIQAQSKVETFTTALYVKYPDLARKAAAQTVGLQEIAGFLPRDAALLNYVVLKARGVDRTLLFCVTSQNGEAVVEAYPVQKTREELTGLVEKFRQACSNPKAAYGSQARALHALLVAPAARQLAGKKQLIICPDGPLWGLPFQVLIARSEQGATEPFLLEQFEISYAYSATAAHATASPAIVAPATAAYARAAHTTLPVKTGGKRSEPTQMLMVVANPDFAGRYQDLPGTQSEAEALKQAFPEALVLTGSQAQETRAKQETSQFRYLHFATHGFLNDVAPLMSSVALAQPPQNSPEDGLLTAREIFDLNLSADMVVLSACDTGRGTQQSGEGMVGLTWALFVAGVPTQVVSQWAVADKSTAELMTAFYTQLKQGTPKGAALRAAALEMLGKRRPGEINRRKVTRDTHDGTTEELTPGEAYAHPFGWAPFVLIGAWQ